MMKYWFPNISYPELFNCNTPLHIIPFVEGFPSICSDNPIIAKNPKYFRVYHDDFIFPLNDKKIFIRGEKLKKFSMVVKMLIDLLIYKQAIKYVSCTNEKYIEQLDNLFEKRFTDLSELRNLIFDQVLE